MTRNALVISGNLRCSFWLVDGKQTLADKFYQAFSPYNCDIFLVTSYHNYVKSAKDKIINNIFTLDEIKQLPYFKQVVDYLIVEDMKDFKERRDKYFQLFEKRFHKNGIVESDWGVKNGHLEENMQFTITDQYLRKQIVFELLEKYEKQHHIKYDNIIYSRPDLLLLHPLDLSSLKEDFIYGAGYAVPREAHFSEQFMYGKAKTMKELFKNLLKNYGKNYGYNKYDRYGPERVVAYYIIALGFNIFETHRNTQSYISNDGEDFYYFQANKK